MELVLLIYHSYTFVYLYLNSIDFPGEHAFLFKRILGSTRGLNRPCLETDFSVCFRVYFWGENSQFWEDKSRHYLSTVMKVVDVGAPHEPSGECRVWDSDWRCWRTPNKHHHTTCSCLGFSAFGTLFPRRPISGVFRRPCTGFGVSSVGLDCELAPMLVDNRELEPDNGQLALT